MFAPLMCDSWIIIAKPSLLTDFGETRHSIGGLHFNTGGTVTREKKLFSLIVIKRVIIIQFNIRFKLSINHIYSHDIMGNPGWLRWQNAVEQKNAYKRLDKETETPMVCV